MINKISVFCGSNHGNDPSFSEMAKALGKEMADREISLVYGGGHVGLMGKIADAVLEANGEVIGVIPDFMVEKELAHPDASQMIITHSMHERKATMVKLSDAFIAMPGGIGTLEELIEIYTWLQLRIINKPIALLNVNGYYNDLIAMLDKMVETQFLKGVHRQRLVVDDNPMRLLDKISNNNYSFEESWYVTS